VPSVRVGLVLGVGWLAGTLACAETPSARVRVVLDGDTIEVARSGRTERVRLIGIDAPEAHDSPKLDRLIAQGQDRAQILALGRDATAFTRDRLLGREVELEFDVETRDRYGRTLAYVWLDGVLFNATVVEAGHARLLTIPPNVRYVERLRVLERAARNAERGLWQVPGAPPRGQSRPSAASP
jgi:micrococcal nuclease